MRFSRYRLRKWSIQVRRRDNGICQLCGTRYDDAEAHHVASKSHHPDLAYDVSNGVTLCGNQSRNQCHLVLHSVFKPTFRYKTTREDWDNFRWLVQWAQSI